jgi:DIS3-like exonuclease 2
MDNKPAGRQNSNGRGRRNQNHTSRRTTQGSNVRTSDSHTTTTTNTIPNGHNNNTSNATVSTVKDTDPYLPHWSKEECLRLYHQTTVNENGIAVTRKGPDATAAKPILRGKLRVLPGLNKNAFVTCDRGLFPNDILITDNYYRNRALDGDVVFVELLQDEANSHNGGNGIVGMTVDEYELSQRTAALDVQDNDNVGRNDDDEAGDLVAANWQDETHYETGQSSLPRETWQEDDIQMDLWNPLVEITKPEAVSRDTIAAARLSTAVVKQLQGRVVRIEPPKAISSDIVSNGKSAGTQTPRRRIVGSIMVLQRNGIVLLTPNHKSLPQFQCFPKDTVHSLLREVEKDCDIKQVLFQAEYEYGSWNASQRQWPPCCNVKFLGESCLIENEIQALLTEYQVDHGDFTSDVLKDVNEIVQSGLFVQPGSTDLEWKPSPDMYVGRRDYRAQRIFTIDPTTAKDLDDALHITNFNDGTVEIGVHIADVSYFVRPDTAVNDEATKRATTVYLVDRTVPMLPRPLCEVACSLNENVERLAFSCVWRMNTDGTIRMKKTNGAKEEDVWYGRTVIKSCARLDYSTAQNIIENKVARLGEDDTESSEDFWPASRRPTGGHTMQEVAADVRLMHRVAMARRQLRFDNGAVALNSVKLTFQLDTDGQTPLLAAPYPIRDSNRLIEEYMLLANYLVAQRLITHAGELACLRNHRSPKIEQMDKAAAVAKAGLNFDIDITSSKSLHKSLVRLGQECSDPLVLTCITQMMTIPMQQAQYFAAGTVPKEDWRHFALNMPYYTHFTSPIRRYPDIIVHRLLQATLDGIESVKNFPQDMHQIEALCLHCSEMQMASKNAQQRCDRIFLALYIRKYPMENQMGIVLSVGQKAFTVYVPSLGADAMLYLDEHKNILTYTSEEGNDKSRKITLQQKKEMKGTRWNTLEIVVFTKLYVTVVCNSKPPIDIKLQFERPY